MSDPLPPADIDVAHAALGWVREAGELALGWFRNQDLEVEHKHDGSPVTRADREAEMLLRERIASAHPDDSVLGEEHGSHEGGSGRTWVIDPIDGTRAFSHGVGTWSNLLHWSDDHGPAVGIINLPALGECVWAVRGHGAFVDDRPIVAPRQVSVAAGPDSAGPGGGGAETAGSLHGSVLCVSGFHGWDTAMWERVQRAGVHVRTWGDAYGYALVATGRAQAMFDPELEWWDLAAPALVIAEAGATITTRDGDDSICVRSREGPYGYSAVASSGGGHELWVELLSRA